MSNLTAKFYKKDDRDWIEIQVKSDQGKNSVRRKITPLDINQFPGEWAAYQSSGMAVSVGGTPLTDLPNVTEDLMVSWRQRGVRNVEELAELTDAALPILGIGAVNWRRIAKAHLALLREERAKHVPAAVEDDAESEGEGIEPTFKRRGRPPKGVTVNA